MQLVFFLGNDLIDAIKLDPEKISVPGYLGQFKRTLQRKYKYLILEEAKLPEFLVVPAMAASGNTHQAAA